MKNLKFNSMYTASEVADLKTAYGFLSAQSNSLNRILTKLLIITKI